MQSTWAWVAPVMTVAGTLGGVWLGSHLTLRREAAARKRETAAHWAALKAEISLCGDLARSYLLESILIPSYRLPRVAFESAFPKLLSAAAENLSDLEARSITEFYMEVESFNRGLDFAQATVAGTRARATEVARSHLKASHLIPGPYFGELTTYDFAMATVAERMGEEYLVNEIWDPSPSIADLSYDIKLRWGEKHGEDYAST